MELDYHFVKFVGYKYCKSKDVMILISYVISQDHVMKGLCNLIGKSP